MRKTLFGMAAVAALVVSSAASASISIGSNVGSTNAVYAGPTPITYDFSSSIPTITGGAIKTGNDGLISSIPLGSDGTYYAVGPGPGNGSQPGVIDLSSYGGTIDSLSFLWGSVDGNTDPAYNVLEFLDASNAVLATFRGTQVAGGGNASGCTTCSDSNRYVQFLLTGTDMTNFRKLRLSSSQNAFEIDDIVIHAVPEPATWALMLVGFAGIGMSLRRRRQTALAQIA
jgi:hypothetical protein